AMRASSRSCVPWLSAVWIVMADHKKRWSAPRLCGLLIVGGQSVDDRIEAAVHHDIELVKGKADAMVGDAVLRKVVRADFFTAIAGADLAAAFGAKGGLLLFQL